MDALLAEHDLSVSPDTAMPADHLAIELALTAHVVAAGDEAAAAAMFQRLAGWVPAFADACSDADGEGFWAGAAAILAAVVASKRPHSQDHQRRSKRIKEGFHVQAIQ